ncbi:MAG: T9SS type A sorting domain-containing protein [Ignavibacteria bacterium]|nr:T9SS type A sorting domain-containing protein [Ignavibacteria bacterium]
MNLLTNLVVFFVLSITLATSAFSQPTKVRLTHPKGGEKFRAGSSVDITWDTTGTYRSRFAFQFGTSPTGPWTTISNLANVLDSGRTRGIVQGGWRVPAIRTQTGYIRMVLLNPDGTLNENVTDINDAPFEIEQPLPIKPDSVLRTPITSRVKLTSKKIYALDGYVFVDSLGVLEIEPGTIIIGDTVGQNSALCINRGGKIFAQGTPNKPIVFTSSAPPGQRRAGDWGGVLICGLASTNHPGGEAALEGGIADANRVRGWFGGRNNPNDNDNSGVLSYVRIEFAGIAAAPNQELNGLTLGGVGRGTKIDHVMVSYANDDSFEWFGGSVDGKYLIAYNGLDDDFDGDNGFSGRIQFGLSIRAPEIADVSTSHAFEFDNDAQGTYNTPHTQAVFSNITVIGPLKDTSWTTGTGPNKYNSRYSTMVQIRRNARLSIVNSVMLGWPKGLEILSSGSQKAAASDSIVLRNNYIYGIKSALFYVDGTNPGIPSDWLLNPNFKNVVDLSSPMKAQLTDPFAEVGLINPVPKSAAPYLNSASFQDVGVVKLSDSYFDKVPYCGAFSPNLIERWDLPWAEYDPINAGYSPSSVEEIQPTIWDLKISPNPTNGIVRVIFKSEGKVFSANIYDLLGNNVYEFNETNLKDSYYELPIDLSGLSEGIYFLQLNVDGKLTVEKIVLKK